MLLFSRRFHEGLISGEITLTFRLWTKARVRAGGRYRCHPIGVLEVDGIERVRIADISDREARRAGFPDRTALLSYLAEGAGGPVRDGTEIFRIRLHHGGDGDRVTLALEADLSEADLAAISARLDRLDKLSCHGPWTRVTLDLIEARPRIAASRLARQVGRDTKPFKADVVKLKKLGLTQSFEVGYEISPRGRAYRERIRAGR